MSTHTEQQTGEPLDLPAPGEAPFDAAPTAAAPNFPEALRKAAIAELDFRTDITSANPNGVPIVAQPADRESWMLGLEAGTRALVRMIPAPDINNPTAFAIEQLWVHQQFVFQHVAIIAKRTADTSELIAVLAAKFAEYEHMLPEPDSIAGRLGRMGAKRGRG